MVLFQKVVKISISTQLVFVGLIYSWWRKKLSEVKGVRTSYKLADGRKPRGGAVNRYYSTGWSPNLSKFHHKVKQIWKPLKRVFVVYGLFWLTSFYGFAFWRKRYYLLWNLKHHWRSAQQLTHSWDVVCLACPK